MFAKPSSIVNGHFICIFARRHTNFSIMIERPSHNWRTLVTSRGLLSAISDGRDADNDLGTVARSEIESCGYEGEGAYDDHGEPALAEPHPTLGQVTQHRAAGTRWRL